MGLVPEPDDKFVPRVKPPHRSFREGLPYEADGVPPLDTPLATFLDPRAPSICAYPVSACRDKSKNTDSRAARVAASIALTSSRRVAVDGENCVFFVRASTVQPRPAGPGFKLSNAHGAKGVIEYDDVPHVAGAVSPALVLHPMSLGSRSVFGLPLELVVNYAMVCPLVHLSPAARARCYALRDALAAGSPWEAERVALVEQFAEARAHTPRAFVCLCNVRFLPKTGERAARAAGDGAHGGPGDGVPVGPARGVRAGVHEFAKALSEREAAGARDGPGRLVPGRQGAAPRAADRRRAEGGPHGGAAAGRAGVRVRAPQPEQREQRQRAAAGVRGVRHAAGQLGRVRRVRRRRPAHAGRPRAGRARHAAERGNGATHAAAARHRTRLENGH